MKNKFRTVFDEHQHYYTNAGSPVSPEYVLRVNESGVQELVQTGVTDLYSEIQSHADSVDIHKIIERFQNGDSIDFNQRPAIYADITEMPKTFAELYQRMVDCENYFNTLPNEIKEAFNYNCGEFIASIGTDKFDDVFSKDINNLIDDVKEVSTNEE